MLPRADLPANPRQLHRLRHAPPNRKQDRFGQSVLDGRSSGISVRGSADQPSGDRTWSSPDRQGARPGPPGTPGLRQGIRGLQPSLSGRAHYGQRACRGDRGGAIRHGVKCQEVGAECQDIRGGNRQPSTPWPPRWVGEAGRPAPWCRPGRRARCGWPRARNQRYSPLASWLQGESGGVRRSPDALTRGIVRARGAGRRLVCRATVVGRLTPALIPRSR